MPSWLVRIEGEAWSLARIPERFQGEGIREEKPFEDTVPVALKVWWGCECL
jgi:hypothetical protein